MALNMAKSSKYVCQQCGYESVGWLGKCPNCDSWGSLVETVTESSKPSKSKGLRSASGLRSISLTSIKSSATRRVSTKISELDRVLGGGLVPGQAVLIAGEPGIGKSTLLLEVSDKLGSVLYVCGEESAPQIKVRADRLGIKKSGISLLEDIDADSVIDQIGTPAAVIVDSIQTVTTGDLSGMAGSVGQVRECAFRLINACKAKGIPLFLVGHVTKEGTVAGPAVLAHIVDTVLWFEGDKTLTTRILRAVKNRFGPTDEVGIFEMQDKGLLPVADAEKLFLEKSRKEVPGSVVTSVMQGTRPLLVEIQALVVPTKLAIPRRVAQGIDSRRLELLLAVLTRRCGLPLYDYDVFVNVAGGLRIAEPASDLAICLAISSAYFDRAVSGRTVAVGEVGLLGEIREVVAQDKRIKEAKRLGFTDPASSRESKYLSQFIHKLFRSTKNA
ncbi:MAG: repair protein radA protein [Candidatus Woesebacteria bacterium GW2011_GWB1_45_5]|uniref:DNA repair protein RadA n=1 Tax=Candidatus Woesebacteria bacterium GW2011_GWB1_45_5 TaxID=1618581 RepID=A0A0G1QQ58_9BACT|nr:MAG: repair protein radA protein [Candidatus Woesebacteria bacterium GW2011_GWB1_45_5]